MSSSFQAALFRLARTLALVEPSRPTRLIAILRKTARLRAACWSRTLQQLLPACGVRGARRSSSSSRTERYRARSVCLTIPKTLRPVQVMAEMRFHDCPQDLCSFGKSALDVVDHTIDVGQHACAYAARVHLGMARQKA